MRYFEKYFSDVDFTMPNQNSEVSVKCPFHDDTNPSANVDISKNTFYCYTCGIGYGEEQFIEHTTDLDSSASVRLLNELEKNSFIDWDITFKADLWVDQQLIEACERLSIPKRTIDDLRLGKDTVKGKDVLAVPVFYNDTLMDIRRYNIYKESGVPKWLSNPGAKTGWVVPFDKWALTDKSEATYILEGEKDMLIAQSLGLNAICLTGGANALPNEFVSKEFKDRKIFIMFDNDEAGRKGSLKLADYLFDYTTDINVIDIRQFVAREKEDFHDYITKYDGDIFALSLAESVPYVKKEREVKKTPLSFALSENLQGKSLIADVSVISDYSEVYSVPAVLRGTKTTIDDDSSMAQGEKRSWELSSRNLQDILPLIEADAKSPQLRAKHLELLFIPSKEKGISIEEFEPTFIYKSSVIDVETDGNMLTLDLYSFDKLSVGSNYTIKYKMYAHPTKHQKLVAIASEVHELGDMSEFEKNVPLLQHFKTEGTVDERLKAQFESAKHYVAKHMSYDIWLMTDLTFNSVLDFEYDGLMRGALDVFFLGDTQVGKSETTSKMTELYNFGHFLSLKTSTTKGLIGGSRAIPNGGYQNTIGSIPRQHKKLAILEEFSGAEPNFIKNMTDIRSSNEVRISRVNGELKVPCKLRMITISNPINDEGGEPRNLSSFPNGVKPIMELIKSAEDVTRYDGFLLCPKPEERINPFTLKLKGEPIPVEAYQHRVKWSSTRLPENVKFDEGIDEYIWEQAEYLNSLFESNIPIFGTTTSRKLARFCVALASLLMNTDDFENITVSKEIVDYMVKWLEQNYSSKYFGLDKVRQEWLMYTTHTQGELEALQEMYENNNTIIEHLASNSKTSRANLQALSGESSDVFSVIFNALARINVIRLDGYNVYPTEKFRTMYRKLDKELKSEINKHSEVKEVEIDFREVLS